MLREYSESHAYGRVMVGDLGETLRFLNVSASIEQLSATELRLSGKFRRLKRIFQGFVWGANSQVFVAFV